MKQYIVRFFVFSLFFISLSIFAKDKQSYTVTLPQFGEFEYTISQVGNQVIGTVSKPTSINPFAYSNLPSAMSSLKRFTLSNIEIVTPPEKSEPIPGNVTLTIQGNINLLGNKFNASFTMKQNDNGYDIVMHIPLPTGFTMGQLIPAIAGTSFGNLSISGSEIIISSAALTEQITVNGKTQPQQISPGINVFGDIAHLSLDLLQPAFENSLLSKMAMDNAHFSIQNLNSFDQFKKQLPSMQLSGSVDLSKLNFKNIPINFGTLNGTINLAPNKLQASLPIDNSISLAGFGNISKANIDIAANVQPIKQSTSIAMTLQGIVSVSLPVVGSVQAKLDALYDSKTEKFDIEAKVDDSTTLKPFANSPISSLQNIELHNLIIKTQTNNNNKTSLVISGNSSIFDTSVQAELRSVSIGGSSQYILTVIMPPKWSVGQAIPTLQSTSIANVTFDSLALIISPVDYVNTTLNLKILKGINIIGSVKKLSFNTLMPKLAASPLRNVTFNDIHFVTQGIYSLTNFDKTQVIFAGNADLSGITSLQNLGDVSNLPLSGSFSTDGILQMETPIKTATGSVNISIVANPNAQTAADKVSISILTQQKLTIPVIGDVEFELSIDADPKNLELKGKIIQPVTIKPFSYISGAPEPLQNIEMGQLEISTQLKAGEPKKITVENAKISGVIQLLDTPVEAMLNPVRQQDGSYQLAVKVSVPPTLPGLPQDMYTPWKASKAISSLAGKPLGDIVFKQLTLVFTQFEFTTPIRQFGNIFNQTMYPFVNIFAEVEKLNAGIILPQLVSTPLNDITLTDVTFSIQKVKDLDALKQEIPSMHIAGTSDFSQMSLPAGISIKTASVSCDISQTRIAMDIQVPDKKGITIPNIGSLGNAHLMVNVDFAQGLQAAPTGFDFSIAGKLVIDPLNGVTVDALLKLPPKPGAPVPTSFAELFQGIKLSDFTMISLTPPDFDITQAIPGLKNSPLANLKFPTMLLSIIPPQTPTISGPALAGLVADLPSTPGINAPSVGKPPTLGALVPGLNLGGQLPKLNFAQLIPQLASSPLADINFQDLNIDMSGLDITQLKKIKPGNLPVIKLKGIADLSSLPINIPGVPSLGAVPLNATIDKVGTLNMKAAFKAAAGLVELDITANPLTQKFSIVTTIHQVIPVPAQLQQYLDVDEIEVRVEAGASTTSAQLTGILIKPLTIKPFAQVSGIPTEFKDLEIGALQIRTKAGVQTNKISLDNAEISGLTKLPGTNVGVYGTIILDKSPTGYDLALKISSPPSHEVLDALEKYAFVKDPKALAALSTPWKVSQAVPVMAGLPLGDLVFENLNFIFTTKDLPTTTFPDLNLPMTKGVNVIGTIAEVEAGLLAPQFKQPPFNGVKLTDVTFMVQKVDDIKNLATKIPDITLSGKADFSKLNLPQITIDEGTFKATIDQKEFRFVGNIPHDIKVNPIVSNSSINIVAQLGPDGLKSAPTNFDIAIDGVAKVNVPVLNQVDVAVDSKVIIDPKTQKVNIAFEADVINPKSLSLATVVPQASALAGISPEMTNLKVKSSLVDGTYKMELFGTVQAFNSNVKAQIDIMKSKAGKLDTVLKLMMEPNWNIKQAIPQLATLPIGDLVFSKLAFVITSLPFEDEELGLDIMEGVNVIGEIGELSLGGLIPQLASVAPINGIKFKNINLVVQQIKSIEDLKNSVPVINFSMDADLSGISQLSQLGNVSNIPVVGNFGPDKTFTFGGKLDAPTGPVKFTISINPSTKQFTINIGMHQTLELPIIGKIEFEIEANADPKSLSLEGKVIQPITIKPFTLIPGASALPPELTDLEIGDMKIKTKIVAGKQKPAQITIDNAELTGVAQFMNTPVETTLILRKINNNYQLAVQMSVPPVDTGLPKAMYQAWKASTAIPILAGKPLGDIVFKQLTVALTPFKFTTNVKRFGKNFDLDMLPIYNIIAEIDELTPELILPALAGTPIDTIKLYDISLLVQNIKDKEQLKTTIPNISVYAKADCSKLTFLPVELDQADIEFDISQTNLHIKLDLAGVDIKIPTGQGVGSMKFATLVNGKLVFDLAFDPVKGFNAPPTKFGISIAGTFDIAAPINIKGVSGVLQLVKTPLPGASLADIFKDIKPADFAFIALTPPNFGLNNMISTMQAIAPGFKLPSQLSSILSSLPKPNLLLAYTPMPLSGPAVSGLMSGLALPQAQLASLATLSNLTPAFNFSATIPLAKLNAFVPPALQNNPLLSGISLQNIVLTGQKLDGKSIPTISFSALSNISGIPLLPDMSNLPIDIIFQEGITKFEIELGKELELPELNLETILDPKLSIVIDLAKKPIGITITISGHSKTKLPVVNVELDIDIMLTITDSGIFMTGKIITPTSIQPFGQMSLPDPLSGLKTVEMTKLAMNADITLVAPITSGAKPEIKTVALTVSGETSISSPISISGKTELQIIQTFKPEAKTDAILKIFPETVALDKMVSGIPPISINLTGSEVIINTIEYTDPNPVIGKLEPGISLYGSYEKVNALKSITLGNLVPEFSGSPFTTISINNGSILIKDMNDPNNVLLDISGQMDLSKVPGINIPYLGNINLTNLLGHLTYSKKDGLTLTIELDQTFDVTFEKRNWGTFKEPRLVFTAKPNAKNPSKYDFAMMLLADGTINLPILGNFDVNAEFDFTTEGLQQKFSFKNDFTYRSIHLKNPYVLLFETKEKQGFELHGLTIMQVFNGSNKVSFRTAQKIDSVFSFMKTTNDKKALHDGGFYVSYLGQFIDSTIAPFKDVVELSGLSDVPPELVDAELHNPILGLYLTKKAQYGYVAGDMNLYGFPAHAGFYAIRDYLGKSGVAVMADYVSADLKIKDLRSKVMPLPVREFYNKFVAPPVRNAYDSLPAQSLGVLISNIQFTFHLGPQGINVFPTANSIETELNAGATIFGTLNSNQLVKDLAQIGTVNILGKKINLFNPRNLSNGVGVTVSFLETYGLSLKDIGFEFIAEDTHFKFNLGDGYKLDPGPFMIGFSAEPSLALVLGVDITTPDGSDLSFAGKAELIEDTAAAGSLFLALGLTMEGIWKQPFGFTWISFGEVAGQVEANITQDVAEDAATEGGGSATDVVDAGAGTAAGTAGAAAEDAEISAAGFTGQLTLGAPNDPLSKTGDFAVNFNSEDAMEFLLLIRLWGKYGSADIASGIGYANQFGQFMLKWYEFLEKAAPAAPKTNKAQIKPPVLPKEDNYKRYQPADKKKDVKSIGGAMKTSKQAITAKAVSVKNVVDTIEKFAANVTPGYVANVQKFMTDLNIYLENMEFHYAADDIEIGDLWFDRGLSAQGILQLHDYQFGFLGFLNYDGIALEGYGPTIDIADFTQWSTASPQLKGQIVITGMGPDGKYGTKDDGPAFNAQLNFQHPPQFVLSGKITIKPLQLEGEGDVTFTLGSGYKFKVKGNFLGLGNITYEAFVGSTDTGKAGVGEKLIFGEDILAKYMGLIVNALKVAKLTGDVASEAAQKSLAAIQTTLKPLNAQKATLETEIATKKADIQKKKDAWKTGITQQITDDKKKLSDLMQQLL